MEAVQKDYDDLPHSSYLLLFQYCAPCLVVLSLRVFLSLSMYRGCFQALLLILVVYSVSLAKPGHIASSATRRETDLHALNPLSRAHLSVGRAANPTSCGFAGNSDLYGLGIRVGYYAQFMTIWIQSYLTTRRSTAIRSVNTLFMLAMLVGLVVLSKSSGNDFAVEAFLLLQIVSVSYFLTPAHVSKSQRKTWDSDIDNIVLTTCIFAFVTAYNIWFWWIGLDKLQRTPCGTFALLFFFRFNMYGPIRKVQQALSLGFLICGLPRTVSNILQAIRAWRVRELDSFEYQESLVDALRKELAQFASAPGGHKCIAVLGRSGNVPSSTPNSAISGPVRRWTTSALSTSGPTKSIVLGTPLHALPTGVTHGATCGQSSSGNGVANQHNASSYTFHHLHQMDLIFDDVIMAVNQKKKAMETKQFNVLGIRCYVLNPITCIHRITKLVKIVCQQSYPEGFPFESLYVLMVHGRLEGHLLTWHAWLTLVEVVLQESRLSSLSWPTAHLISGIRLSKTTKADQSLRWLNYAIGCLLIVIVQVVSVELTIRWNNIRGLQNIGTMGQLVPLMIGIGGLSSVLYGECKARWFGRLLFDTPQDSDRPVNQDLADAYYGCKQYREMLFGPSPTAVMPP